MLRWKDLPSVIFIIIPFRTIDRYHQLMQTLVSWQICQLTKLLRGLIVRGVIGKH